MELKIDVNGVGKRVGARGGESGRILGAGVCQGQVGHGRQFVLDAWYFNSKARQEHGV